MKIRQPFPTGDFIECAKWLAADGQPVFPVVGKKPHPSLAPNGFKSATTSKVAIDSWRNLPVITGYGLTPPEGVFVLDVDPGKAGLESLARLGQLPETFTVRTGTGGYHMYFAGDTFQRNAFRPGLDTRTHGMGYVIGPGSIHPLTGAKYMVVTDTKVAEAPRWLCSMIKNTSRRCW